MQPILDTVLPAKITLRIKKDAYEYIISEEGMLESMLFIEYLMDGVFNKAENQNLRFYTLVANEGDKIVITHSRSDIESLTDPEYFLINGKPLPDNVAQEIINIEDHIFRLVGKNGKINRLLREFLTELNRISSTKSSTKSSTLFNPSSLYGRGGRRSHKKAHKKSRRSHKKNHKKTLRRRR